MAAAWEDVYAKIKVSLLADIKKEIGEIDFSGSIFRDIAQCAKAAVDILKVLNKYTTDLESLDHNGRRSLFGKAFDDSLKLPIWLEPWDDNAGAALYDLFASA